MEKLFYSSKEKIVFYIVGYVDTENVDAMIKVLEDGKKELFKACNDNSIKESVVQSYEIRKSSRYKNMRVFYVMNVPKSPENAFQLGGSWTMDAWITN